MLKLPSKIKLTPSELKWWNRAIDGQEDCLLDPDFIADNPDMKTLKGQKDDLKYRLEQQAYGVIHTDASPGELRSRIQILNSLNKKLEEFFN